MVNRQIQPDNAPVAPADQTDLTSFQAIQQASDIRGHEIIGNLFLWCRAAAVSTAIHGDGPIPALNEYRDQVPKIARATVASVEQQHRRARRLRVPLRVPDPSPVDHEMLAQRVGWEAWNYRSSIVVVAKCSVRPVRVAVGLLSASLHGWWSPSVLPLCSGAAF
jgi:hypothetical protein